MKLNRISLLVLVLAAPIVISWLSPLALAQESAGVKISPSIIEERVDPGQIFTSALQINNLGREPGTFYIVTRNISGLSPEGKPIFAAEGEPTGLELISWIKITDEPIIIGGGAAKTVPFSIAVPKEATPGAHIGSIFLATSAERPKETGIGVGYQVATIINLRISGEILEEAEIREFRADKNLYSQPRVKFLTKIENLGNVVVRPRGPIEITDMFDRPIATLTLNESAAAILPKSARVFEADWQGDNLTFGRYQALMSLVYGEDGKKTITGTVSFWVLPLKIILPSVGGLIALILLIFLFVKLHIRKKLRELRQASAEAIHKSALGPLERELLHPPKGAPVSRAALLTIVLLLFTLSFLLVLFFFFA